MSGGIWTFNIQDGFVEALARGSKLALLTPDDYRKLGLAETLEDVRSVLEDTDYGLFLQDEPTPIAVTTIGTKCHEKMANEFRYLQGQANYPLNKFFGFIVAERMIDNIVSLIQGVMNKKSAEELLARADPLGWSPEMKTLLTLDPTAGYDELYRTVLVDTPVGGYFEAYLMNQEVSNKQHQAERQSGAKTVEEVGEALSEIDLEFMRASLKKSWLEDFYAFCLEIGGTTGEVMGHILKRQADYLVLSVTLNSLNSPTSASSQLSDRNALYPSFGYLYPAGTDAMRKSYNDATIRSALDCHNVYLDLYEQCCGFYIKDQEAEVQELVKMEEQMSLEDAIYRHELKMYEMTFEQSMHYGVFYAWMKLKEQEIRNILWIADMVSEYAPLAFSSCQDLISMTLETTDLDEPERPIEPASSPHLRSKNLDNRKNTTKNHSSPTAIYLPPAGISVCWLDKLIRNTSIYDYMVWRHREGPKRTSSSTTTTKHNIRHDMIISPWS